MRDREIAGLVPAQCVYKAMEIYLAPNKGLTGDMVARRMFAALCEGSEDSITWPEIKKADAPAPALSHSHEPVPTVITGGYRD